MSRSFRRVLSSTGVLAALAITPLVLFLNSSPAGASTTPASQPVTGIASTSNSAGYWQGGAHGLAVRTGHTGDHRRGVLLGHRLKLRRPAAHGAERPDRRHRPHPEQRRLLAGRRRRRRLY